MEMIEMAWWIAEHSVEAFVIWILFICTVAFVSWRCTA